MFPHLLGDLSCGLKMFMGERNGKQFDYLFFFLSSTDSNIPPGTVLFTNGVPYTYQNGMAIFQSPEGSYPVPQPQVMGSTLEKRGYSQCASSFRILFSYFSQIGVGRWGGVKKEEKLCVYMTQLPHFE